MHHTETKQFLRRLVPVLLFVLLVVLGLIGATKLLERKDSRVKYASFFQEAEEGHLDILLMGNSHVINGISPLRLWQTSGYTAYNMGGHGSPMQATYWEYRLARQYCRPQVVVVDTYMLERDYQYLDEPDDITDPDTTIEQLHLNMDAFPLNRMKKEALEDLIHDTDKRESFRLTLRVYHDRWKSLTEEDFRALQKGYIGSGLMGAEIRTGINRHPAITADPGSEVTPLQSETVGTKYLRRIIESCQEDGIQIILTQVPFNTELADREATYTAQAIAAEYGIPFFVFPQDTVDLMIDENDDGHLNLMGMIRATDALGAFLQQETALVDHRGDTAYDHCYEQLAGQHQLAITNRVMAEESGLLEKLLAAQAMEDQGLVLYINSGSGLWSDEAALRLIERLAGTPAVWEAAAGDTPYLLVREPHADGQGAVNCWEAWGDGSLEDVPSAIGHLYYYPVEQRFRFLYTAEDMDVNYLYDDAHIDEDVRLFCYGPDGETTPVQYFRSMGTDYLRVK
ncbi:MAG: hypothetical protein IJT34_05560 [Butyrivibrio sp.]|nr:hypothetical protein [Butyrivibrio sp.]